MKSYYLRRKQRLSDSEGTIRFSSLRNSGKPEQKNMASLLELQGTNVKNTRENKTKKQELQQ